MGITLCDSCFLSTSELLMHSYPAYPTSAESFSQALRAESSRKDPNPEGRAAYLYLGFPDGCLPEYSHVLLPQETMPETWQWRGCGWILSCERQRPTCPESQWLESRRGEGTTSPWRDFLIQVRVEGVAHPQNPNSPPLPDLKDHRTTPILTKTCQVLTSFILLMSQSILPRPDPSLLAKTISHITVYIWLQKQPPVRFLHNYCAAL